MIRPPVGSRVRNKHDHEYPKHKGIVVAHFGPANGFNSFILIKRDDGKGWSGKSYRHLNIIHDLLDNDIYWAVDSAYIEVFEESIEKCECGADISNTTHSDWCKLYRPYT